MQSDRERARQNSPDGQFNSPRFLAGQPPPWKDVQANYLRDKVPQALITNEKVAKVLFQALQLADTPGASKLPGFCGHRPIEQFPTLEKIKQRVSVRHGADDTAPDLPPVQHKKHTTAK